MSFVTNVLTPIIQLAFYVFIFGGIGFLGYRWVKKNRLFFKYKIFRKKYPEKYMKWCVEAIELDYNEVEIKKKLLINGYPMKSVEEIAFIFREMQKQSKGGKKNGQRTKKTS